MAYLQRKNAKRKRPCYVCSEACVTSYIYCEECSCFCHIHCEKISGEKVKQLEQLPPDFPYICRKCRCDDNGDYDYISAQARLQKAATNCYKKLQACVKRELLFLDTQHINEQHEGNVNLLIDMEARSIMHDFLPKDTGVPAMISANDSQLFRAVSVAFCAQESVAAELRVRCCIEMVQYEQYYRYQKNHHKIERCAPSYMDSCIDCAIEEEGSSAWTVSALASVVRRRITSVYPPINGTADPAYQTLNTTFEPRQKPFCEQTYRILWCSHDPEVQRGRWKPTTFVPIFDAEKPKEVNGEENGQEESLDDIDEAENAMEDGEMESTDVDPTEAQSGTSMVSVSPTVQELREEMLKDKASLEVAVGGFPVTGIRFMESHEAFQTILGAKEVKSDIPRGLKENVYFLLDNSHTLQHPERRNSFYDDCGQWDNKKTSISKMYFLIEESGNIGSSLKICDGKFAAQVKKEGSAIVWNVLDPQPDPDCLVVCHKHYSFHKLGKTYKRRITWFTVPPGFKGGEVAIAEYIGIFPGYPKSSWQTGDADSKSSTPKTPYTRTDPKLMEKITDVVKESAEMTPMELLRKLHEKFGPDCPIRDRKQIANIKYQIWKKMKKDGVDIPKRERPKSTTIAKTYAAKAPKPRFVIQANPDGDRGLEGTVPSGTTNFVAIRDGNQVHYVQIQSTAQSVAKQSERPQEFVQVVMGPQPKFVLKDDEEVESCRQLQSLLTGNTIQVQSSKQGHTAHMHAGRVETPQPESYMGPGHHALVEVKMEPETATPALPSVPAAPQSSETLEQVHIVQIQNGDQTKMLQIPAGRAVNILEMEDGQQAISVVNINANGCLDPSTESVYMVSDLLSSHSTINSLGQEMIYL